MVLAIVIIFGIVSFICSIIVLIDAFEDEIWKGLLALVIPFYLLYYALVEFEHERKWLIVGGMLLSTLVSLGAPMLFSP